MQCRNWPLPLLAPEDGREPQAKECRQFLEAGKDQKKNQTNTNSLLELQQKSADLLTPQFLAQRQSWTFDLLRFK